VSTTLYSTPEQPLKTEEDQDWVLISVDDGKKSPTAGSKMEMEFDVKLGWGEKKLTVFRYCWKSESKAERCGNCASCKELLKTGGEALNLATTGATG
jgi:hypothetical protein